MTTNEDMCFLIKLDKQLNKKPCKGCRQIERLGVTCTKWEH